MKKDVSVIIPTFNRKEKLKMCLKALALQTWPKQKFEIIVTDDGSTDGTKEEIIKIKKNLNLCNIKYFKQKNKGPASARNFGVKKAKGKYLLFMDDDIIASPKLIEEHLKAHKRKKMAVVGYISWHPKVKITPFMKYSSSYGYQFAYGMIKDPDNLDYNLFYTANISLNKEWFKEELFDERFQFVCCDDTEIGYRLQKKGLKIALNRKALAYHIHHYTFRDFCMRQFRVGKSLRLLYEKWPELKRTLKFYKKTALGRPPLEPFKAVIIPPASFIVSYLDSIKIPFSKHIYNFILDYYTYRGYKYN